MKYFFYLCFILATLLSIDTMSQGNPESIPQFKYGNNAFYQYMLTEINIPDSAKGHTPLKAYIQFVVDTNGNIHDVRCLQKVGYGVDEEGIRVVEKTNGLWIPAKKEFKKIEMSVVLPLAFIEKDIYLEELELITDQLEKYNKPGAMDGNMANAYYEAGVQEFNKGNTEKAIEYFNKAIIKKPCDVDALYNIAIIYLQKENMEYACKYWKQGRGCGDFELNRLYKENCKGK